jgi:hypothetical protein
MKIYTITCPRCGATLQNGQWSRSSGTPPPLPSPSIMQSTHRREKGK